MHYDYPAFVAALASRIKSIRQARGLTQTDMVRQYGYHLSHWGDLEAGRRMSLPTLLRIANSVDMTLQELLEGIERLDGLGYGSKGFTPPPGSDLSEGE